MLSLAYTGQAFHFDKSLVVMDPDRGRELTMER